MNKEYVAAIVDHKLSVVMSSSSPYYTPRITFSSKSESLANHVLNVCFPLFKSVVVSVNKKNEVYFCLYTSNKRKIKEFLSDLLPFLIIKKKVSMHIINFINNFKRTVAHKEITTEQFAFRHEVYKLVCDECKLIRRNLVQIDCKITPSLEYLGGFLDVCGSLKVAYKAAIKSSTGISDEYNQVVTVTSLYDFIIDGLVFYFPSFNQYHSRNIGGTISRNLKMQNPKEIIKFLSSVLKFIHYKKENAIMLIDYCETKKTPFNKKKGVGHLEQLKREKYFKDLKKNRKKYNL
jgi:hypothetical protein